MVQETMTYIDSTPDLKTKLELIDTLRTVTEGKVCSRQIIVLRMCSISINKIYCCI